MKTARAVPNVQAFSRHRPHCKFAARDGKKAAPERLSAMVTPEGPLPRQESLRTRQRGQRIPVRTRCS